MADGIFSKQNIITFLFSLGLAIVLVFFARTSVFVLPGLAAILVFRNKSFNLNPIKNISFMICLVFLGFALLSSSWSVSPLHSVKGASGAMGLLVAAFYLKDNIGHNDQDNIIQIIKWTFVLALGLWILDLMMSGELFKVFQHYSRRVKENEIMHFVFKPTSFVMGALLFPVIGALLLRGEKYLSLLVFAFAIFGCFVSKSSTALLGVLAGGAIFVAARICSKFTYYAMVLFVAIYTTLFPLLFKVSGLKEYVEATGSTDSFFHRLVIWDFSITNWLERPFLGWGAGASRAIPGGNEDYVPGLVKLSLHPHNFIIQTYLELGAMGLGILVFALLFFLYNVNKKLQTSRARAIVFATFSAIIVFASGEHSIWHHWWLGIAGLGIVLSLFIAEKLDETQSG